MLETRVFIRRYSFTYTLKCTQIKSHTFIQTIRKNVNYKLYLFLSIPMSLNNILWRRLMRFTHVSLLPN